VKYFGFKNWDRYQTKKRNTNAKLQLLTLHTDMLDDPKTHGMTSSQFGIFIRLLLVARKNDNKIPWPWPNLTLEEYMKRVPTEREDPGELAHGGATVRPRCRPGATPLAAWMRARLLPRGEHRGLDLRFLWVLDLLEAVDVHTGREGEGDREGYGSAPSATKKNITPPFNPRPGKKLSVHDHNQQVLENVFGSVGSDDEG
jgi:hypothetical protein